MSNIWSTPTHEGAVTTEIPLAIKKSKICFTPKMKKAPSKRMSVKTPKSRSKEKCSDKDPTREPKAPNKLKHIKLTASSYLTPFNVVISFIWCKAESSGMEA